MTRAAGLWLLLAVLWFGTLGIRPLYKADESRYAEISREMVASGDWLTPRLNGFKYFEKPPLQYWTTAAFFSVLGESDWVARLWTALIGLAGIALTFHAGNRLFGPPTGLYAAAILAGSPLYVVLGQVNTLDMSVSVFLAAAIFAFAMGRMLGFWLACAAAVLSKGLIGIVLPLAAVGLYMLLRRDWALIGRIRPVAGLLLFLLVAAPWFVAASLANAEFAHFFFIQEHFQRFTTEMHQRAQPAWYFLAVLAAGMAPWLVPLGRSVYRWTRERTGVETLLWIWVLVVLAFFSASSSKLPPYILPVFPALAVLVARAVTRRVLVVQAWILLPVCVGAGLAIHRLAAAGPYAAYGLWLLVAMLVLAASALAALAYRNVTASVLSLALGGLVATQIGLAGHGTLAERFSAAGTVARLPAPIPPQAPVFAVDTYDHTIPWALKRTVTMVRHKDELAVAIGWEPRKFIDSFEGFARAWQAAPQAWAFVAPGEIERLRREYGVALVEVARGPTFAIVKKP
ncbi:MAG TPA: glycosyltransferase family 39 protein [Burkholderiales bacterium]|nr:glycosyltransferase family 39 protein [Burkholderiales bacterium]